MNQQLTEGTVKQLSALLVKRTQEMKMAPRKMGRAIRYDAPIKVAELADGRTRCFLSLLQQDHTLRQVLRSAYLQGVNDALEVAVERIEPRPDLKRT